MQMKRKRSTRALINDEVDFDKIRETEALIMKAKRAPNTLQTYASSWRLFVRWCEAVHLSPLLRLETKTVRDFATWSLTE